MFGTVWTVQGLNPGGNKRLYFLQIVQIILGLTQPPVQCVSGLSPGSKAAGEWCYQPPPPPQSTAEAKERVGPYLLLLILWAFIAGFRENLALTFMRANKLQTC